MKKFYYVYSIKHIESGKFYYGFRGCDIGIDPHNDLGIIYFTSGSLKEDFKQNTDSYQKTILFVSPCNKSAYRKEQVLIEAHLGDPLCMNKQYDKKAFKQAKTKSIKKFLPVYFDETIQSNVMVYPSGYSKKKSRRR